MGAIDSGTGILMAGTIIYSCVYSHLLIPFYVRTNNPRSFSQTGKSDSGYVSVILSVF
jgi:hypothetical protein